MTYRNPEAPQPDREMVPRILLRAMFALVLVALALTGYAVATNRPLEGVPAAGAIVQERTIRLVGGGAQAVTVLDADGTVIADMAHGGFVTVIQNGLQTERRKHGIDPALPVHLRRYDNGRLAVEDPLTGWSVELYAFGGDNKAAFERLLQK
jgi:putative photosynthetic complex assembly protein